MDAADLAPALLGLANLVKAANSQVNGERSNVKVLISVDNEHKCFEFVVEIVQTIMQRLAMFAENDSVATAKEIAERVGIIGSPGIGLFGAYKWLKKQNVTLTELNKEEHGSEVTLRNVIGSDITVNINTYNLMTKPEVVGHVQDVVRPLTREGYDKLQFEDDGTIADEFSSDDARYICAISPESLEVRHLVNKSTFEARVKVKRPDYLGDSQWAVIHDKAIMAKVEDANWLERFHKMEVLVPPGSYLRVMLRIEIMLDGNNDPMGEPRHFIAKVLSVIPPDQQGELFADSPS